MNLIIAIAVVALLLMFGGPLLKKLPGFFRSLMYAGQGLAALAIAAGLFFLAPFGIQLLDPTAGAYDFGVITRAVAGAAVFFLGTFCAWLAIWVDWPDVLKWADREEETPKGRKAPNSLMQAWGKFPDSQKIWFLLALFLGLLAFFSTCVFLIPA